MPLTDQTGSPSKVAIVTGGSRGIGRRIAERLAQAHYTVVISYRSDEARADEVVAAITAAGGTARAVRGDVADEVAMGGLFATAERDFGGVDIVVHAAAVLTTRPLVDLSLDEIDGMLRTNLRGTLVVDRQAARTVRPGGSIINISSAITRHLAPEYTAYAATKAALEAITVVLARELSGRDITVNAVAPGPTETEMFLTDLAVSDDGEQKRQWIIDSTPLGRIGQPDDIADVVLALVGLRWIHGQVIHASGGIA